MLIELEAKRSAGGWSREESELSCRTHASGEAIRVSSGNAVLIPSDTGGKADTLRVGDVTTKECVRLLSLRLVRALPLAKNS